MDSDNNSNPFYTIDGEGWAVCERCSRMIKGGSKDATLRQIALHLLREHSISVYVGANVSKAVDGPMYIPPRRNGTSVVRSLSTASSDLY